MKEPSLTLHSLAIQADEPVPLDQMYVVDFNHLCQCSLTMLWLFTAQLLQVA